VLRCAVSFYGAPQNSMTPLHYAAWQGSIDCVQLLLEHKADINKADAVSRAREVWCACFGGEGGSLTPTSTIHVLTAGGHKTRLQEACFLGREGT
jgi:hypothetical protein